MGIRGSIAFISLLTLVACADASTGVGYGFKERYSSARSALETGNYGAAARQYARLADDHRDNPLAVRLQLEMSHALLRDGDYSNAWVTAQQLATSQVGPPRLMALAVQGTAQHELARQRMSLGDYGPETRQLLQSAQLALDEVVRGSTASDEGQAMQRRLATLNSELAALG